jgi:uncharacterized protein (TIGR03000 family)
MYSIVLLMALSGSGEMPVAGCGGRGGHAARGCHGGRRHHGGGCGSGGCGSGGCGAGGCGMAYGGSAGGCAGGVCAIGGHGMGMAMADTAPATIIVSLPEDATLTIQETATTSTTANRVFVSPDLESGKDYQYTLKAKVMRDGKPVVMEETITVRAGEETQVTLKLPATTVAAR